MTLRSNGCLLVHVKGAQINLWAAGELNPDLALVGYDLESLVEPHVVKALFALETDTADHWVHAKPQVASLVEPHPWDQAHKAASASDYAHFIEPDIIHDRAVAPAGTLGHGMDDNWAPSGAVDISPGWHLERGFTGFAEVRQIATGAGIRIAHLDTGYTPNHMSKPRHLRADLGKDFVTNGDDPVDPGIAHALQNAGHGTATLAILAGNTVNLTYNGKTYQGDFGGAPDAEVVPVRISESVVHIASSTMFKGMMYALAPRGEPANRVDVVTISHGGLPAASWADAVNKLYEAGVFVAAASGDSFHMIPVSVPTRFTVYPSAFNRVLTVVGVTYAKGPYIINKIGKMQGCWGPKRVMDKAIAGFTPNVAWMRPDTLAPQPLPGPPGTYFVMDGSGTSASTPQAAAAAALFLQVNKATLTAEFHDPWRWVEAVRLALFDSSDKSHPDHAELGWGPLDVIKLLDPATATKAIADAKHAAKMGEDKVSAPFWRLLLGLEPANSQQDAMYEVEVAQIVASSRNPQLIALVDATPASASVSKDEAKALLLAEPISQALRAKLTA